MKQLTIDGIGYAYELKDKEIKLVSAYRTCFISADSLLAKAKTYSEDRTEAPGHWSEIFAEQYITRHIEEYIRENFKFARNPFRLHDSMHYRGYLIDEAYYGSGFKIQVENDSEFVWSENTLEEAIESIDYKIEEQIARMDDSELMEYALKLVGISTRGSIAVHELHLNQLKGFRKLAEQSGTFRQLTPEQWGRVIHEFNSVPS